MALKGDRDGMNKCVSQTALGFKYQKPFSNIT